MERNTLGTTQAILSWLSFPIYSHKPQSVSLACTLRNSLPSLSTRPSTPKILLVIDYSLTKCMTFVISDFNKGGDATWYSNSQQLKPEVQQKFREMEIIPFDNPP